jgi:hypothetical protein
MRLPIAGARCLISRLSNESGAEATADQTLRACQAAPDRANRQDCGAFTPAFELNDVLEPT